MPIRIIMTSERGRTLIKIAGQLKRADMDELIRTFQELDGPAVLDLMELQSVDREAVVQLREFIDLGLEVQAASPYIELLLKSGSGQKRSKDTA